jgi:hypothetical protein
MKAKYTRSIKTVSGKLGKFVHLHVKNGEKGVIRKHFKPELSGHNQDFGSAMKNMVAIWKSCSDGFKNELRTYTLKRKQYYSQDEVPAHTNFAHFIRFLHRFKAENPQIDLKTVTREELEIAGIPTSVATIVKQDFLPSIPDSETLTENW